MTPNTGIDSTSEIARMEATLNRMLRESAWRRGQGARLGDLRADQGWNWLDGDSGGVAGVEVTEHRLPEGVDFFTFQTLVGALH
ncbi:MAG TPA: hypothetical protein PKC59_10450 [Burkholderiaceae bacterium]|nr:hypothetical protein [Burkholderiaceae bacterium]HMX11297.1 hypothetical protein [Burkholderiaceae bacterium]HMZ01091.1 hypothetical protein [Burkholderiaceae bacterium]HNB46254.1 hypothetical protein [Burkholderiaceae bacterium]HNG81441.1 hypothetical protein [Burkholderiaceae bacterium]